MGRYLDNHIGLGDIDGVIPHFREENSVQVIAVLELFQDHGPLGVGRSAIYKRSPEVPPILSERKYIVRENDNLDARAKWQMSMSENDNKMRRVHYGYLVAPCLFMIIHQKLAHLELVRIHHVQHLLPILILLLEVLPAIDGTISTSIGKMRSTKQIKRVQASTRTGKIPSSWDTTLRHIGHLQ